MKLTKKIVPTVLALSVSMGTLAAFPLTADSAAINWDTISVWGAEWLPHDFESAMDFYNTYGSTKVDDDTICILRHVPDDYQMTADIKTTYNYEGNRPDSEYEANIFTYNFKLPEEPDKSDAKAYAQYLDMMRTYEMTGIAETGSIGYHYEALVIYDNLADILDVNIKLKDKETGEFLSGGVDYSFERLDGEQIETDIYSWLPDSVPEFNNYIRENGNISYRDDMLIYCDNINYSTGASLDVQQKGSGKLKLVSDGGPVRDYVMRPAGGTDSVMKIYKGEAAGNVDITFTSGRAWATDAGDHKEMTASVYVDPNLNITKRNNLGPEWIPQNFEEAVDFANEHGATFVNDGIICFVRQIRSDKVNYYSVSFEGKAAEKIRNYELMNSMYISPEKNGVAYNVRVYEIPNDSDIKVYFKYGRYEEEMLPLASYSFKKDSSGYITQTDIYSWLPDCDEEFNAYYDKHGAFSIQDGYVMFCTNVPLYSYDDIFIEQNGAGRFIEKHEESSSKQTAADSENVEQKHVIKLFKPIKTGMVKITVTDKSNYKNDQKYKYYTAYYRINDDMSIVPADEEDIKTNVKGDCNGDGMVGVSDVVTLSRWLSGEGKLSEYGMADANGDGKVDVFDLVAIRKQIISGIREEPRPVMIFINENYAWFLFQNVTVIDQYGTAYGMRLSQELRDWSDASDSILSMYRSNWYEKVLDIMADSNKIANYIPDAAMTEVNKFAENAEKYSNTELNGIGYMCDAGSDTLYLVNKDANGDPVAAEIATFGDFVGWINDDEVKDFVKMLSSYDIYGEQIISVLEHEIERF